jgi:DNA polymerase-3 subunit chi
MTQVSFYALSSTDQNSRQQFACRLADKAVRLGHRVFLQVDSPEQARQMDALLWQFKPASFLPHSIAESGQPAAEQLVIGTESDQKAFDDVFINLSRTPCQNLDRYQRVNEVLSADPGELDLGRQNYRYYQQQGCKPETHKL